MSAECSRSSAVRPKSERRDPLLNTPAFAPRAAAFVVGGFVPLSSVDYPDELAAVVFGQGCPWRCGYCHNPHLQSRRGRNELSWSALLAFLARRKGLLDAVVFSGGEPTLQRDLPHALAEVRELGFKTGLHTAGVSPARLAAALPLLDWVGMDIKATFGRYAEVTAVPASGRHARASARLVIESGVAHEFRTTMCPGLVDADDVRAIAAALAKLGARHYALQPFRPQGCSSDFSARVAARAIDPRLCGEISPLFEHFTLRQI